MNKPEDEKDETAAEKTSNAEAASEGEDNSGGEETPALAVIRAFGGIRPMASKLGLAVSTVQGWRERHAIPAARHAEIEEAAKAQGIELPPGALEASAGASTAKDASEGAEAAAVEAEAVEPPVRPVVTSSQAGSSARRSPVAAFLLGGFVFAAGFVAAALLRDAWLPYLAGTPGAEERVEPAQVEALERRIGALESAPGGASEIALGEIKATLSQDIGVLRARLDSMAERMDRLGEAARGANGTGVDAADITELQMRLGSLTARTADLEERADAFALTKEMARLQGEVGEIGERLASLQQMESRSPTALLLAIVQLRERMASTAPYGEQLEILKRVAGADAELSQHYAALEAFADQGLPSFSGLKRDFPAAAREAVAAAQGEQEQGWIAGVVRRVGEVVTVRPTGEIEGESAGAVIARAEVRLSDDELADAVGELTALKGAAASAMTPWKARAEGRIAAEEAINAIGARAISRLTGDIGG